MMQIETDKFRAAVGLTNDYYTAIEEKLIADPSEKPVAHVYNGPVEENLPAEGELPPV